MRPGDRVIDSNSNNENLHVLSSINSSKDSIQTVVLNKEANSASFQYLRDNNISDICMPERSIITIVDKL